MWGNDDGTNGGSDNNRYNGSNRHPNSSVNNKNRINRQNMSTSNSSPTKSFSNYSANNNSPSQAAASSLPSQDDGGQLFTTFQPNTNKREKMIAISKAEEEQYAKFIEENTLKSVHEIHRLGGATATNPRDLKEAREAFLRKVAPSKVERKELERKKHLEWKQQEEAELQIKKDEQRKKAEMNVTMDALQQMRLYEQAQKQKEKFLLDKDSDFWKPVTPPSSIKNEREERETAKPFQNQQKLTLTPSERRELDRQKWKNQDDAEIQQKKEEQRRKTDMNARLEQLDQQRRHEQAQLQKEKMLNRYLNK